LIRVHLSGRVRGHIFLVYIKACMYMNTSVRGKTIELVRVAIAVFVSHTHRPYLLLCGHMNRHANTHTQNTHTHSHKHVPPPPTPPPPVPYTHTHTHTHTHTQTNTNT
jgi:hypothetical protein